MSFLNKGKDIVYSKFFDKKAGFISKKWLPVFANYRRDGYDFDALYEDGKAPHKHKKITVAKVCLHTKISYCSIKTFFSIFSEPSFYFEFVRKRKNKKGIEYGWDVAVYSSVEHIYGYDYVTSCYKEEPAESWNRLVEYMHEAYPIATDKQIRKLLR